MNMVMRWAGKRTSGRYVYRCVGGWYWQCDLHPDLEYDDDGNMLPQYGTDFGPTVPTQQEAFAAALVHATQACKYSNSEES